MVLAERASLSRCYITKARQEPRPTRFSSGYIIFPNSAQSHFEDTP